MKAHVACTLILLATAPAASRALADPPPEQQPLTIHPAVIPSDPLKYRLLPAAEDQTPGNAAVVYLSTFALAGELNADKSFQQLRDLPADAPVGTAGEDFVGRNPRIFQDLKIAGRRAWCLWDPPIREEGIDFESRYLGDARTLAYFASIAARSAIGKRDFGAAALALQSGFSLADNLDREPFALQALFALGVQSLMLDSMRLYVQQPDAPNLYWALANVPPLDRERGRMFEIESASLFLMCPELKHAEVLSAEQAGSVVKRLWRLSGEGQTNEKAATILTMVRAYPAAREYLLKTGISGTAVEAVPPNAAVLAFWVDDYRKQIHEIGKWAGLPLWQALPGLETAARELADRRPEGNPLMVVVPGYYSISVQFGRVERDMAMMQTVEAIRAYAAANHGQVPPSLAELSPDTPAPLDPLSGKPFEYHGSGKSATLRSPAPPGERRNLERVFRITVSD